MSNSDYVTFIDSKKSGLIKTKGIMESSISCSIKTPKYMVLRERAKSEKINSIIVSREEVNNASEAIFFNFEIWNTKQIDPLKYQLKTEKEYFHRLKTVEFEMPSYVTVISGIDTLSNIYSVYERDFGISGRLLIHMSYKKLNSGQIKGPVTIVFNDMLLGLGKITFEYSELDLNQKDI